MNSVPILHPWDRAARQKLPFKGKADRRSRASSFKGKMKLLSDLLENLEVKEMQTL
ncbi:hypothetical protein X975_04415, partial [Stegodyphus mimosarum]